MILSTEPPAQNDLVQPLLDLAQDLSPQELLAETFRRFAGRVALATSLGAEDQVLTDLLVKAVGPEQARIFTLDTGRLPQETYDTLEATRKKYGLSIKVVCPRQEDLEAMLLTDGPNGFYSSVENRKRCCHVRKVIPLQRELAKLDAWITGLRREQAATRQGIERVEWDAANGLIKVNPLVSWSTDEVWKYLRDNEVPYNALHDRGYPSIGCAPCTRAVAPGEDIRAGRWWWEQPEHKECGLHMVDGKLTRKNQSE